MKECMATLLMLIQYASLHSIATSPLAPNISDKELRSQQAVKSHQLYQSNTILRFLLYRLLIVSDSLLDNKNNTDNKVSTQQISISHLFLVHLLQAFFSADVNAHALIKELLAMTTDVVVNKLTMNRPIERTTAYTLLCAYQSRYPHILPIPPTLPSTLSMEINSRVCTSVFRNLPDSIFDTRSSITNTAASVEQAAFDRILNLVNKFGDSYFQVYCGIS